MIIIRRHPNRKIYDLHASRYTDHKSLRDYIRQGIPFKVIQFPGGNDVTEWMIKALAKDIFAEYGTLEEAMTIIKRWHVVEMTPCSTLIP